MIGNWQLILIAILLFLLVSSGVYIKLLISQKETLEAEKVTLSTQLTASQANVLQLKNDIGAQNDAIAKLKSDADAWVKSHETEVKKAQTLAANYKKRADDLLKVQVPQNVSKCDAATMLIREELKYAR